jgi:hypothetical protein
LHSPGSSSSVMCWSRAELPSRTPARGLSLPFSDGGFPHESRSNAASPSRGSVAAALAAAHLPAPQLAARLADAVGRHAVLRPRHRRGVGSIRSIGPVIGRCRDAAGAVGNGKEGSQASHHGHTTHVTHSFALGASPKAHSKRRINHNVPHRGLVLQAKTADSAFAKSAVESNI